MYQLDTKQERRFYPHVAPGFQYEEADEQARTDFLMSGYVRVQKVEEAGSPVGTVRLNYAFFGFSQNMEAWNELDVAVRAAHQYSATLRGHVPQEDTDARER